MPQYFQTPYGRAATINFVLFEADGVDFRINAVHASGDTAVMIDQGAEANTNAGFTDEGNGYSIALTAAELSGARVTVYVIDQSGTKVWLDEALIIETTDHPSAAHPNGVLEAGTAQAGGASTITLRSGASTTNDYYIGDRVDIVSGTGAGQSGFITAYVGATRVATISSSWATNPDNTSYYEIKGDSITEVTIPTAAAIADAVWDEATADHVAAGSFGKQQADVLEDTNELESTGVNVTRVNSVVLTGTGVETTDEWRPA
jgi:hypothetical protein